MNNVPFAAEGDMNEIKAVLTHRLRVVKRFMGNPNFDKLRSLDIGASNKFGRELGIKDNTWGDLNNKVVVFGHNNGYKYDLITCFEVIEHVMNPLLLMKGIHVILRDNGRCFVATPCPTFIPFLMSGEHLTEYRRGKLERLFLHAGFKIKKYKRFCIWDWWFAFTGIRPMLRVLFHQNQIWELKKATE